MKKILCIVALTLSAGSVFAQLYLRGNIGYNLPANSQVIGSNFNEAYDSDEGYTYSEEAVYGSFGSGLSFNLGFGASINGALGYDVELGYLIGKKYSTKDTYDDVYYTDYTETNQTDMSSSSFQIAPSLTFTAGTGNIQPYTRIGPVLGFTKLKVEQTNHDTYFDNKVVTEYELTGGMSIGFKGVLGVNFNADKKVQFFAEVNFLSMSYAPTDGEITAYTIDGENAIDSIPKEQRKIEFKDKITSDDEALREKYSMGSFGIQVGVKYLLK